MKTSHLKYNHLYFPGLISLIGLPFLLITYVLLSGKMLKPSGMQMVMIDDYYFHHIQQLGDKRDFKKEVLEKNYTDVVLGADFAGNMKKLNGLGERLTRMKKTHDYNQAYRVVFTPSMNYASMVAAMDLCQQKVGSDLLSLNYKSNIFIFHHKSITLKKAVPAPTVFVCGNQYLYSKPEFSVNNNKSEWWQCLLTDWLALIFLVLMFISHWSKR